jgi:hypothetical protein
MAPFDLTGHLILLVQVTALLAESILFIAMARWYFVAGPIIARQRWQTALGVDDAVAVVEGALAGAELAWRRFGTTFAVRRPWWKVSAYPRVVLRVEPTAEGAALVAEVKPFVSGALFLYPAFLGNPELVWLSVGVAAVVLGMYAWFYFHELPRLKAMELLRDGLARAGVRACAKCGYDRYGLAARSPCPECGAAVEGEDL